MCVCVCVCVKGGHLKVQSVPVLMLISHTHLPCPVDKIIQFGDCKVHSIVQPSPGGWCRSRGGSGRGSGGSLLAADGHYTVTAR